MRICARTLHLHVLKRNVNVCSIKRLMLCVLLITCHVTLASVLHQLGYTRLPKFLQKHLYSTIRDLRQRQVIGSDNVDDFPFAAVNVVATATAFGDQRLSRRQSQVISQDNVGGLHEAAVNVVTPTVTSDVAVNVTTVTTSTCRPSILYDGKVLRRDGAVVYPEDIMSIKPFKYLPNFRNPCFMTPETNSISCFPYYYLVGAPKSGTTDLSRRIARHPQVSEKVPKEPHWLTRIIGNSTKAYRTLSKDYLSIFARATRDIIGSGNTSTYTKVLGDCSASTLWDHEYWPLLQENKNRSEPRHTNAMFIHHLNPGAKIIAVLRNPIDRLYSDYLFFNGQHISAEKFHDYAEKAIAYFSDCFKRCSHRHCLYTNSFVHALQQVRLHIGLYYYSVADYMKVFPRDQVLVLKTEAYSVNMTHYIRQVYSFLELDPLDETDMAYITDTRKIYNTMPGYKLKVGSMLPETRKLLYSFYKPYNEKLEKLLGTKLWEDESKA